MVGLDYIANPLLNGSGGVMAMVTGHPEQAYQRGCELAELMYWTDVPVGMDVVFANAWPKDAEGTQIGMGLTPIRSTARPVVAEEGSLVVMGACPEGLGYHSVMGPGTLFRMRGTRAGSGGTLRQNRSIDYIFSPGMNRFDVQAQWGTRTDVGSTLQFCKTWDALMEALERKHGPSARAAVFPYGALQYTRD
jgi:hypothetical protein